MFQGAPHSALDVQRKVLPLHVAGTAKAHLLCKSSLVRFRISFGDTVAVAPVPDF
jgi:hypothetical protein